MVSVGTKYETFLAAGGGGGGNYWRCHVRHFVQLKACDVQFVDKVARSLSQEGWMHVQSMNYGGCKLARHSHFKGC